jgi:hypothetical protein
VQRLGAAGFRAVLNYAGLNGGLEAVRRYADAANAAGVKVIWPLHARPWRGHEEARKASPALAASCGCETVDDLLATVVGALRGHPATWGWYIGDELSREDAPAVADLAARVRALDGDHPLLYVANGATKFPGGDLDPFTAAADYIGASIYPVGTPAETWAVGPTAAAVQQVASRTGKSSFTVLQAFSWAQYPGVSPTPTPRWPSREDMRRARDAALANSTPGLLLWYSLKDIEASDDPAGHFADLAWAATGPPTTPEPTEAPGQRRAAGVTATPRRTRTAARGRTVRPAGRKKAARGRKPAGARKRKAARRPARSRRAERKTRRGPAPRARARVLRKAEWRVPR